MKIKVTKEDIKRGVVKAAEMCPIALALGNMGAKNTTVDDRRIAFNMAGFENTLNFITPAIAKSFVQDFDAARPVKPFSFEL